MVQHLDTAISDVLDEITESLAPVLTKLSGTVVNIEDGVEWIESWLRGHRGLRNVDSRFCRLVVLMICSTLTN